MSTRRLWLWGLVFAALALSVVAGIVWLVTENMGGVR